MIYWHVTRRATCIYSQLKRGSSSEVASMIKGVLRYCTDTEIQRQYVDSMDGKGRCIDNVFVGRLWRSLQYQEV